MKLPAISPCRVLRAPGPSRASWCPPCRTETPLLERTWEAHRDRVTIVGVASKDVAAEARGFMAEFGVSYTNIFDGSGDIRARLGLRGFPTTYVFGSDGLLRTTIVGGLTEQRLAAVLGQMAATSAEVAAEGDTAFVALGPQFLNFRRFELMGLVKAMGFKMPPLVCRGAVVAASAQVGENSWIGAGALVGADAQLGFNCVLGAGAQVGAGSRIGHSVWLAPGVLVGTACTVGAHATLDMGVLVANGVQIGKQCVLQKPGRVAADVPAKRFHLASFTEPVVVYGS